MDEATRHQLGGSFTRDADRYAASRPTYPRSAVEWMTGKAAGDVLDLGAGAGALTTSLLAAGQRVVAAEPSAAMLAELVVTCAGAPAVQSRAEQLPFAAAAFDAVPVATAFHWFDAARALPEIARVLSPGGVLALTWNTRAETGMPARRLGQLLRDVQPAALTGDWATGSVVAVEKSDLFGRLAYAEFPFTQRLTRDGLVGLVASRSYVRALGAADRQRLLHDVAELFDTAATPALEASATLAIPYRTQCWRARRRTTTSGG